MLPKERCCEYTQTFRQETGRRKLSLIETDPWPVAAEVKEGT